MPIRPSPSHLSTCPLPLPCDAWPLTQPLAVLPAQRAASTRSRAHRDNPRNRPLSERFGVLSFPVGKIFHRGRLVGDFMGGSLAHEIVTEMLTVNN